MLDKGVVVERVVQYLELAKAVALRTGVGVTESDKDDRVIVEIARLLRDEDYDD